MKLRKWISGIACNVFFFFLASPAQAGIPVIDGTNLAQQIQQVISWGQQARQMIDQINQLQQQFQQLQTMTTKLDGARALGTILNDPSVQAALPPEMRNATQLLLNPAALATSQANLNQILASFGVDTTAHASAGRAVADTLGRAQQILASAQARGTQLQQLAARVDTTADAKESLDMVNRNILETANINNQMMQTMASLEAARQAADLQRLSEQQQYYNSARTAAAAPRITISY